MITRVKQVKAIVLFILVTFISFRSIVSPSLESSRLIDRVTDNDQLLSVQIIYRHGDRTPYWLYHTDRYTEGDFPEGIGQLITRGKERMFRYGIKLRQRYRKFLDHIKPSNIIAQSSPVRRSVESSEILLADLFTPDRSHSAAIAHWQPISVETTALNRSWKLNPDCPCARAEKIEKNIETSVAELKQFLATNRAFMQQIGMYSGEDYLHHLSWQHIGELYDTLFTEQLYFGERFIWPYWIDSHVWHRLAQFNSMVFSIYGKSPEYLKIRVGTLLKEVIQNFLKVANEPQSEAKLFTYGSHDNMIAYLLHALGLFSEQATYGSGLILELRRNSQNSETNVHLFYANVTNNYDIYPLFLNQSRRLHQWCPEAHCPLRNFAQSLRDFIEHNVESDCNL